MPAKEFFEFGSFHHGDDDKSILPIHIPAGISSRQELFSAYKGLLKFPYFGNNWDSLEECLSDLTWLDCSQVVMIHHDLPLESEIDAQKILLRVLSQVQSHSSDHKLRVFFPESSKEKVQMLLAEV